MPEAPGREHFSDRIGQSYTAALPDGRTVELEVEEVRDYGAADGSRFSVFLTAVDEVFLPQAIYRITPAGDEGAAGFDLFLVPVGHERDRYRYEAAFNRSD